MLSCTTHENHGVLIITVEDAPAGGEDRIAGERETLYNTIKTRDDGRFAIDLGLLNYISSADIGFLIGMRQRVDRRKGKLVLFSVDPYILDTLATMKFLQLFVIAADLPDALSRLG